MIQFIVQLLSLVVIVVLSILLFIWETKATERYEEESKKLMEKQNELIGQQKIIIEQQKNIEKEQLIASVTSIIINNDEVTLEGKREVLSWYYDKAEAMKKTIGIDFGVPILDIIASKSRPDQPDAEAVTAMVTATKTKPPKTTRWKEYPAVYFYIPDERQYEKIKGIASVLKENGKKVRKIFKGEKYLTRKTELRYFHESSEKEAEEIAQIIQQAGVKAKTRFTKGYSDKVNPRIYELWFAQPK